MRTLIIALIFTTQTPSGLSAQGMKIDMLAFDQADSVADFGTVLAGPNAQRLVYFANVGNEHIIITAIVGSDGGMLLSKGQTSPELIKPGQRVALEWSYYTIDKCCGWTNTKTFSVFYRGIKSGVELEKKFTIKIRVIKDSVAVSK